MRLLIGGDGESSDAMHELRNACMAWDAPRCKRVRLSVFEKLFVARELPRPLDGNIESVCGLNK